MGGLRHDATPSDSTERVAGAGAPLPLRPGEWLLVIAFWAFIAALSAANALLDPRSPGLFALGGSVPILIAVLQSAIWAALTVPIFRLAHHVGVERGNWLPRLLVVLLIGIAIAIAVDSINGWLRFGVFPTSARRAAIPFGPMTTITHFFFIDDFIVFLVVLSGGIARSYSTRLRIRQGEAARLEAETARLGAQLAEARLTALRSQIDPHFLFNTLHAISSLVERDPRGVRRMIARLSELLRERLATGDAQETTLERELDSLERYLDIMRIRFQGNLDVHQAIDPATHAAVVPTLILQPIVENAIKHGVAQRSEGGVVELRTRVDDDTLLITVRDNGPGPGASPAATGEGLGVRNTRARLEALYGSDQHFVLRPVEGGGAEAELAIPFHTMDDLRTAEVPSTGDRLAADERPASGAWQ
jgi:signal transduction histidine kinase